MVLKQKIKISNIIGMETFGDLLNISAENLKEFLREIFIFITDIKRVEEVIFEAISYIPELIYEELSLYIYNNLYRFEDVRIYLINNLKKTTNITKDMEKLSEWSMQQLDEITIEIKIKDLKTFYKKNLDLLTEEASWKNLNAKKIKNIFLEGISGMTMEDFMNPILKNIFQELVEF